MGKLGRSETNLFVPYKALGLISSSVSPVCVPPAPAQAHSLVLCALDNVVVAYTLGHKLRMAFSTEPFNSQIDSMAADAFRFYICLNDNSIVFVKRIAPQVERCLFIGGGGPKLILSLTEHLTVVDRNNTIHLIEVPTGERVVELANGDQFDVTAIVHPSTYLNKILVGAADGRLRLWNLRSGQMVHEFPTSGDFNAPITVLEQSTAIDVIGIGMADGRIHLRNIKFDKVICTFRHNVRITALAFRSDGEDILASANSAGALAIWDLNDKMLLVHLPGAHSASINWLHFLPGQPYMFSSGNDNRIVKWFFRDKNSAPEIDTALEGHSAPASALRFWTDSLIVSASRDSRVRCFDTNNIHRIKSMGLAREVKKGNLSNDRFVDIPLNPIVEIAVSRGRESVWDNMICRHESSPLVSTWSTRLAKRGAHLFCHERFSTNPRLLSAVASSIFISNCGTYALIGYTSGHVDVYNMQSGKYKFSLEKPTKEQNSLTDKCGECKAHEGAVTGVVLDLLNRHAVTGASNGVVHFWQFQHANPSHPPTLRSRITVSAPISQFTIDLNNSLLAVGLQNGEVGVVDVICRRLSRRLSHSACIDWPEDARLTALEFSGDGKWLLSADSQGYLKVWDLVSSFLIDVIHCAAPCIGISYGERGNYLATCHKGERGVYLWANKAMFLDTAIPTFQADELHPEKITALPSIAQIVNEHGQGAGGGEKSADESEKEAEEGEEHPRETRVVLIDEDEDEENENVTCTSLMSAETNREQLDPTFFTLSGLPPARWAGLPMLEQIRARNKPQEAPKKPKTAPFFLPTVETLEGGMQFDEFALRGAKEKIEEEINKEDGFTESEQRRTATAIRRKGQQNSLLHNQWTEALMTAHSYEGMCNVFSRLKEMSVTSLDFHMRSLSSVSQFNQFLRMLLVQLETRRDFELVQAYLATFINLHHDAIWSDGQSKSADDEDLESEEFIQTKEHEQKLFYGNLEKLMKLQQQAVDSLQLIFDETIAVNEFIKSALHGL